MGCSCVDDHAEHFNQIVELSKGNTNRFISVPRPWKPFEPNCSMPCDQFLERLAHHGLRSEELMQFSHLAQKTPMSNPKLDHRKRIESRLS